MTDTATLKIGSGALTAQIALVGAELRDLADANGRALQWDGDPAVWNGRAPILFPIVGTLVDGHYRHDGRTYAMARHGFARRSTFEVVAHAATSATLRLRADDTTRAVYPFEFELTIAYAIEGPVLTIAATIANRGPTPMPASLGFHPAFRWPLPYGEPRADHALRFAQDEPAPVRRLDGDGLLLPDARPTPVVGATLPLADALFADDALIFDRLAGRSVRYGAPRGPALEVGFHGFPLLGVWSKPGAGFVCIEPWQGVTDPVGFDGELREKPGIVILAPEAARSFAMTIALVDGLERALP